MYTHPRVICANHTSSSEVTHSMPQRTTPGCDQPWSRRVSRAPMEDFSSASFAPLPLNMNDKSHCEHSLTSWCPSRRCNHDSLRPSRFVCNR